MSRLLAALATALLVIYGCSVSGSTTAAEAAGPRFHRMLDEGGLAEIYAASSEELKGATTQQDFVSLLDAVHRKLGKTKSSTKQGWNINYHTSGTFVTLAYKTSYEQGEADEQFIFRMQANVP